MHSFRRRLASTALGVAVSAAGLLAVASPVAPTVAGAAGTPTLAVGNGSVHEGDTGGKRTVALTVSLSEVSATTVTVDYSLMPMSATPGVDYKALTTPVKTLTFKPGVVQKPVSVPVFPDTVVEGDEVFHVMLANATGGAVIGDDEGVATIINDDPGSGLRVGVGDSTVYEGDAKVRAARFPVTLSDKAVANVTVGVMVMGGTASAGKPSTGGDFKAVSKTLTFFPGQFKKMVAVPVYSDLDDESDETFHVMLQNVSGATVADGMGMGTIVDDDTGAPVTTETFRIGPFNLAPEGQAGDQNESMQPVGRPAGHIGIKSMRFDLVDAEGQSVGHDVAHLHHIVMLDQSRPDSLCPSLPNRFGGSGMERTDLVLAGDYAYETGATDQWQGLWHVMNQSASSQTLYIQYQVDYITDLSNIRPVTSYFYDVDNCWGDSEFNVPGNGGTGSVFTKSINYVAPRAGTRVFTGGHLHEGGIDLTLSQNGSPVCTATAMYMPNGMLHHISSCAGETPVAAGTSLTVSGRYDNSAPQIGQMGIMVSYVWEP